MAEYICVDVSLAIKWVLPEEGSERAEILLGKWLSAGRLLIAPHLFIYEVISILRKKVLRKEINEAEGLKALHLLGKLDIQLETPSGLPDLAFKLSNELNRPEAYDSSYLALARLMGCEFWTADKKLSVSVQYPWVKHL